MHEPLHPAARRAAQRDYQRICGVNAVRALFLRRPEQVLALNYVEARRPVAGPLCRYLARHRRPYDEVTPERLARLAGTEHHGGIMALASPRRAEPLGMPPQPALFGGRLLPVLDGIGNPHNFGAILRSAAHFGVAAVLLPKDSPLALSGAAVRVAEGGAEAVPLVRLGRSDNAIAQLRGLGFELLATVVRGGESLYARPLPERCVWVLGAEGEGLDLALAAACSRKVGIPGSGRVESLNVASATAVLLAEWCRQRR